MDSGALDTYKYPVINTDPICYWAETITAVGIEVGLELFYLFLYEYVIGSAHGLNKRVSIILLHLFQRLPTRE